MTGRPTQFEVPVSIGRSLAVTGVRARPTVCAEELSRVGSERPPTPIVDELAFSVQVEFARFTVGGKDWRLTTWHMRIQLGFGLALGVELPVLCLHLRGISTMRCGLS